MASNIFTTVSLRFLRTRNLRTNKKSRKIVLIPPAGPLAFVAIDIFRSLPKTERRNKYIVVILGSYLKLTKAFQLAKTMATGTVNIFKEYWVASFRISSTVLTNDGSRFTSRLFAALCEELRLKTIATTMYHPQVDRQVERFNPTMISRLGHYVAKIQRTGTCSCFLWGTGIAYTCIVPPVCPNSD